MTSIVTVRAETWPLLVSVNTTHHYEDAGRRASGWNCVDYFVPAHTTREFTVTEHNHLDISELPADATGLPSTLGVAVNGEDNG